MTGARRPAARHSASRPSRVQKGNRRLSSRAVARGSMSAAAFQKASMKPIPPPG
jgi:hypothetical protein